MISCGWKASTAANIIGIIRLLVRKEIFWSAVINLFFQGFNWLMTLADLFFSYLEKCLACLVPVTKGEKDSQTMKQKTQTVSSRVFLRYRNSIRQSSGTSFNNKIIFMATA
jgi:hypothetical protein